MPLSIKSVCMSFLSQIHQIDIAAQTKLLVSTCLMPSVHNLINSIIDAPRLFYKDMEFH